MPPAALSLLVVWLLAAPATHALAPAPVQTPGELLVGRMEFAVGASMGLAGDVEIIGTLETSGASFDRRILVRRAPFAYREELTFRPPQGAEGAAAAPPVGVDGRSVWISDGRCAWTLVDDSGNGGLLRGTNAVALLDNALFIRLLVDPYGALTALDRRARWFPASFAARHATPAERAGPAPATSELLFLASRHGTQWNAFVDAASGRIQRTVDATEASERGFRLEEWVTLDGFALPTRLVETLPGGSVTVTRVQSVRAGLAHADELFTGGPLTYLDDVTDAGPLCIVHHPVPGAAQYLLTDTTVAGGDKATNSLWIAFDTGASAIFVASEVAEAMGLPTIAAETSIGAAGGGRSPVRWLDSLRLGRHFILQTPATSLSLPRSHEQPADRPLAIVVGGPRLLERCPVLDLQAGRLLLRGPDAAGAVRPLAGIAGRPTLSVPIFDNGMGVPLIDVSIGGRVIRALLDTGSASVLRLTRSDLRSLGLPDDDATWRERGAVPFGMAGAMGHFAEQSLVRLDGDLVVGPVTYRSPWVLIAAAAIEEPDSGAASCTLLGGGALLPFAQVGFDWVGKRLELVPREDGARGADLVVPAPGEFLGFVLDRPAKETPEWPANLPRIDEVIEGTPARRAGLQRGDYLAAVDGVPCTGRAPMDLWPSLWPVAREGLTHMDLEVVREGIAKRILVELP